MTEESKSPLPARPGFSGGSVPLGRQGQTEVIGKKVESKLDGKNWKVLAGVGVVAVVIIVMVAKLVMGGKAGVTGEVELNYWGLWEEPNVMMGVIADFEAENAGIKINYTRKDKNNYRTLLKGRLAKTGAEGAESVGAEVPDIFRIHSSWIPMFSSNLATVPGEVATRIDLEGDFYDAYKRDIRSKNGVYFGIPLMYDGLLMFYNKDLLGNEKVPISWWELENVAKKLTVKNDQGRITVAGVAMGLTDNVDHWSDVVGVMLKQNGADILKESTKVGDVLAYYSRFRTRYEVWDETLPPSTQFFANGKLAFYFGPSWRVFNIEDLNPELNYGVAKVPQLPTLAGVPADQIQSEADLTNIFWSSYWVEGVNKNSSKQAAAFRFLEYLASTEALEKMYLAAAQTRAFGEIYPRKSMAGKLAGEWRVAPLVATADNASGWYLASETYDDGLNDEMSQYFKDAINGLVLLGKRQEDVVVDLQNGIGQLTLKYKLEAE